VSGTKYTAVAAILVAVCSLAAMAQKTPSAHPLDLNVTNVKELEEVPGIGPKNRASDRGVPA
jgi:DNA uptake protein ComE-like DNA-binding protein